MKKIKLEKKFRTKWLKALTSGSYRQADGILVDVKKSKNNYCCLGVACRMINIPVKDMDTKEMPSELLPKEKKQLPAAFFANSFARNKDSKFAKDLAKKNDAGDSFKKIAKYIEKTTVGV